MSDFGPFEGLVPEIPLSRPPLATVLVQVKFPRSPALADPERVLNQLKTNYPILRSQPAGAFQLGLGIGSMVNPAPNNIYTDLKRYYQVTVGEDAVTLQVTKYSSRDDFLSRFDNVLSDLMPIASPPVIDRLGVRYINQIKNPELRLIDELVRPELLGGLAIPATSEESIEHTILDSLFTTGLSTASSIGESSQLRVRSGWVPAAAMVDPGVPVSEAPSFLIDLDASLDGSIPSDLKVISRASRILAESTYRFFRWSVTPQFLKTFGSAE